MSWIEELHEGSHIKLSNFELLRNIFTLIPEHIKDGSIKKGINTPTEIIKNLWNYVEDRRIDQYVFKSAYSIEVIIEKCMINTLMIK